MAERKIEYDITAKDSTKKGFKSVQKNAEKTGKNVDKEFSTAFNSIDKKLGGFGNKFKSAFGQVAAFAKSGAGAVTGLGLAITLATAATVKFTNALAKENDTIVKNAKKLSLSTHEYEKLDFALNIAGTNIDKARSSFSRLTSVVASALQGAKTSIQIFKDIGVSIHTASGDVKTSGEIFTEVSRKLADMKDKGEQAAFANRFFGRSYQEIIPFLNEGSEGIKALIHEGEQYITMTDKMAVESERNVDAQLRLSRTWDKLKNVFAEPFIASVTDMIDMFRNVLQKAQPAIDLIGQGINKFIIEPVRLAIPAFQRLIGSMIRLINIGDIVKVILKGIGILFTFLVKIVISLVEVFSIATNAVSIFGNSLIQLGSESIQFVVDKIITLIQAIETIPFLDKLVPDSAIDNLKTANKLFKGIEDSARQSRIEAEASINASLAGIKGLFVGEAPTPNTKVSKTSIPAGNEPTITSLTGGGKGVDIQKEFKQLNEQFKTFMQELRNEIDNEAQKTLDSLKSSLVSNTTNIVSILGNINDEVVQVLGQSFNELNNITINVLEKIITKEIEFKDVLGSIAQGIVETNNMITGVLNAKAQQRIENMNKEKEALTEQYAHEKKILTTRRLTQREFNRAIVKLDAEKAEKEAEITKKQEAERKKAAKDSLVIQLISAIANTALGVTQALASGPPPASIVMAAIVGGLGAGATALIGSQLAKFAKGGIINGPEQGDNVLVRANGGEAVMNKAQQRRLLDIADGRMSNSQPVSISVGDTIVNGNADENTVSLLQEQKNQHIENLRNMLEEMNFNGTLKPIIQNAA